MVFIENPIIKIRHRIRVEVMNKLGFSLRNLIFVLVITIRLVIHSVSMMSIVLMESRDIEGETGIGLLIGE